MIKVKTKEELENANLNAGESARVSSSQKKFLIRVEDEIHLSNNWVRFLREQRADVPSSVVEVYSLI